MALATLASLGALPQPVHAQAPPPLVIRGVTVVDGSRPEPRPDQTVVIRGGRIVEAGPTSGVRIPEDARVLDGSGRFLVPGYWDMHVHTVVPGGREVLPLYVANGVTSVRDMAGELEPIRAWRAEIAAGSLVGPRIVAAGPYIEGGDVPIPHVLARTPEEAAVAVDSLVRLGVDFVKLHSQLNREVYFAAARAAGARGMRVAGHVPRTISVTEASDSGVSSLEHLLQFRAWCTAADSARLMPRHPIQRVLGPCTAEDQTPVFRRLAGNGTRVVPTLVAQLQVASWPRSGVPGDSFAVFLPDTLKRFVAQIFPMPDSVPPDADVVGLGLFERRVRLVGDLHRAGVVVLPGTDAPLRNSPPGFGLHQELAYFAEGGMSPFEVLRAATLEPARYLGMADSLGLVAPGHVADLVLLEADPLQDVANLGRILSVVRAGRPVRPGSLRRIYR